MNSLGRHVLAELEGCDPARLSDLSRVRSAMLEAARLSGATVVTDSFHHFAPLGVSGVVIVSESHLALHTWPEHQFAAVDFFTCGGGVDIAKAMEALKASFGAERMTGVEIGRGPLRLP